jgi:hypothetical protein
MQLVRSDAMKRSVGTQSNDVTRYIDGMLPAYANDADTAFTAGCSDRADRLVWRSNDRHIHTHSEGSATSNHKGQNIISYHLAHLQSALRVAFDR